MSKAVSAYRHLIRSVKTTFKQDEYMQAGAFKEIRQKFEESRHETDEGKREHLIGEAREAANFLQTYVVQAQLNNRGNFEMKVEPHHAETSAEEAALRPDRS